MTPIIISWHLACTALHPRRVFSLIKKSAQTYAHAWIAFMRHFGWIMAVDAVFILAFGDILGRATQHVTAGKAIDGMFILIMFLHGIMWFVASSAFFLLLRKNDGSTPKEYFRAFFFRYVHILLIFSLLSLVGLYLLISAGITKLPHLPWTATLLLKMAEFCTIFYWLDGHSSVMNFVRSVERTANLVFYNAPFLIALVALFWGSDFCLRSLAQLITQTPLQHLLFTNSFVNLMPATPTLAQLGKFLGIKYVTFFCEYFLLSIVFVFYRRKKHEQYAPSIFERS